MQKCQIPKFVIDILWTRPFWDFKTYVKTQRSFKTLAPHGDIGPKKLETGCFQFRGVPWRQADPKSKNCLCRVRMVLNILLRSFHSIKSYSYFSQRKTDIHTYTDTCPSIHIQMGENFYAIFDTLYFTTFASLTLFIRIKCSLNFFVGGDGGAILCKNAKFPPKSNRYNLFIPKNQNSGRRYI